MILAVQLIAWLVALIWIQKVIAAAIGLPRVPNLILPEYNLSPEGNPSPHRHRPRSQRGH